MASSGGSKAGKSARPKSQPKVKAKPTVTKKPELRLSTQGRSALANPAPQMPTATKVADSAPAPREPIGPRKWVIVQLSSNGEREKNIPVIIRAARQILRDKTIEVCVPAVSQKVRDDSHTMFYWDGYVFIEYRQGCPYLKLNETTYFANVLCQPGFGMGRQRVFSFLMDKDLEPMRRGLENMKLGEFSEKDDVKIVKGQFKNLLGRVSYVHENGENVQVYVGLRSKQILMDFPSSYLVKVIS